MPIKPQRLQKGDTVGIIAPASPPNLENLQRSILFLERELELKVKLGRHLKREYGYLAGKDNERLEDLHNMFLDKDVKAIICACGGYGTSRIASKIDYEVIKSNPKIFWGYSDITYLHTAIHQQTGLITFHGPMLASDIGKEDADPISKQFFKQLFEPQEITYTEQFSPLEVLVEGEAIGPLVGGNLSLLTSTLGTPFEIDTRRKLLLIEDINEEPRSIDRMLNQLHMAGKLIDAAGIIVGDFHNCEPKRDKTFVLDEVIEHYIQVAGKPAIKGFKIGHCFPHIAVPLGSTAKLNTAKKQLIVDCGIQ
ncbi:L,D-carboxypeptidase [Bacillus methanolicus PB1]|uniref:L,D-carboxypeptidase n=1 Tax=Bacillus methanolicus PB1 TaxID=997296 RepID=I3DVG6_BACMT|nr:LD-carboxypeptidase [Bacillus methanolicus]EIJ78237.1 L,D-carboxypeptidase [Bacillus methanolicus PB1]